MSARENILTRIRRHTPESPARAAQPQELSVVLGIEESRKAAFSHRAGLLASTVEEISRLTEVPLAIANYLKLNKLSTEAVCWPELAGLPWQAAGLTVEPRPALAPDVIGITGVFCAIAETGTLMMLSGTATPAVNSLLPETHIAVVPAQRIVQTMEQAWQLLRNERFIVPRAVNFISGPSRTADIEQTVTLGAHGPYRLHIIIYNHNVGNTDI